MAFHTEKQLYEYEVLGADTDYHDSLQLHTLFTMLQEAASMNAATRGFGAKDMDRLDICWLLLRMSVDMKRLPNWQEKVYVKTWSLGYEKLLFSRDFEIYDEQNNQIGEAHSAWLIADKKSHRPIRPSSIEGMEAFLSPNIKYSLVTPRINPIVIQGETDQLPIICKYADYCEIDRNMHVNNTKYIAWSLDAIHSNSIETPIVKKIDINYSSEVKFGEKVLMYTTVTDQTIQVDGFEAASNRHVFSSIATLS